MLRVNIVRSCLLCKKLYFLISIPLSLHFSYIRQKKISHSNLCSKYLFTQHFSVSHPIYFVTVAKIVNQLLPSSHFYLSIFQSKLFLSPIYLPKKLSLNALLTKEYSTSLCHSNYLLADT